MSPCRAPIGWLSPLPCLITRHLHVCYISQLLRDSFSVSQQPPIWEPPSHDSMHLPLTSHISNSDTFNFSVIAFRQSSDCNEPRGCRVSAVFMSRDNHRVTRHNEGDITRDTGPGGHCYSTLALITQLQADTASPAWNKGNIFSSFRISKLEPFPPLRPVSVSPGAGLMTSRRQCQCGAGVLQWYNRQNTGGS